MTYAFPTMFALRSHLELKQSEMAEALGISSRSYMKIESHPIADLDEKTQKLLERASLDFAAEYGDTSLALPTIAQIAAVFVSRMTRDEARRLRTQRT